jgi:predicted HAD superfamily Cof-like phosphohydrolase
MKWLKQLWAYLTYDEFEDVRACHKKFGILEARTPAKLADGLAKERIDFLQEELNEFREAVETGDIEGQADALIDLVYVAKGTAVMMGLPWEKLWDDVQRANMEKVRGVGKRGHAVDLVKPAGWKPPQTGRILQEAGYVKGLRRGY